jgi:hypothetical protein
VLTGNTYVLALLFFFGVALQAPQSEIVGFTIDGISCCLRHNYHINSYPLTLGQNTSLRSYIGVRYHYDLFLTVPLLNIDK